MTLRETPPQVRCATIGLALALFGVFGVAPTQADGSSPALASYYDRHMAIMDGVAYGWIGKEPPRRLRAGVRQVGVSRDVYYGLADDGALLAWRDGALAPASLMTAVASFAAGDSGLLAIDQKSVLWSIKRDGAPQRIAADVVAASVGDGANYYVTADGGLYVAGRAHRGQYGDGRLREADGFIRTAENVVDVKAHTGHVILLLRNGDVLGAGGNIYGPVGRHGLGDKAIVWGRIFQGARAIATGASHSAAVDRDGRLWAWEANYGPDPKPVLNDVVAVAAGASDTIALRTDGSLWQWRGAAAPRRRNDAAQ